MPLRAFGKIGFSGPVAQGHLSPSPLPSINSPTPSGTQASLSFDAATSRPRSQWALYVTREAAGGPPAAVVGMGKFWTHSPTVWDRLMPAQTLSSWGALWAGRVVWGGGCVQGGVGSHRQRGPADGAPGERHSGRRMAGGRSSPPPGLVGRRTLRWHSAQSPVFWQSWDSGLPALKPGESPVLGRCPELRKAVSVLSGLGSFLPVRRPLSRTILARPAQGHFVHTPPHAWEAIFHLSEMSSGRSCRPAPQLLLREPWLFLPPSSTATLHCALQLSRGAQSSLFLYCLCPCTQAIPSA